MAIDALLSRLEARPVVTSVTSRPAPAVTRKPAPALACTSVTSVTSESNNAGAQAAEPAYWAWLVRYPNGAAFRCHFTPEQTRSQVQAARPQAVSVEPLPDEPTAQAMPLHSKDDRAVRNWLAHINETDPELIEEFMDRCRRDSEALLYTLRECAASEADTAIYDLSQMGGEATP